MLCRQEEPFFLILNLSKRWQVWATAAKNVIITRIMNISDVRSKKRIVFLIRMLLHRHSSILTIEISRPRIEFSFKKKGSLDSKRNRSSTWDFEATIEIFPNMEQRMINNKKMLLNKRCISLSKRIVCFSCAIKPKKKTGNLKDYLKLYH